MATTPEQTTLAELRSNAFTQLLMVAFFGWLCFFVGQLLVGEVVYSAWWQQPYWVTPLALYAAWRLHARQYPLAALWILIATFGLLPCIALLQYPPPAAAYVFCVVPVVLASVLVGRKAEFLVAGVLVLLVNGITLMQIPGPLSPEAVGETWSRTWAPSFVLVLVAAISHSNGRNVAAMVLWAMDSWRKDAKRNQLLIEQQQQLQEMNSQLEYANAKLERLNTELSEARRIADLANATKTRFLANVSHELRTPLAIILGNSEGLLHTLREASSDTNETAQRTTVHIQRNATHLSRVINDLLDLSKAEVNVLELDPELIATHPFLEELFTSVAYSGGAHFFSSGLPDGVRWQLDLPARLPHIQADPTRLRQIVLNLLSNAAKYTRSGQITLGAEVQLPYLHLWVEDTGTGIPLEHQERIFEPFVTLAAPNARMPGAGLGLSIARQLVQLHNGTMTLSSRPGDGSTFHVYLPLPRATEQPVTVGGDDTDVLLLFAPDGHIAPEIVELGRRQELPIKHVQAIQELTALLETRRPAALIWDVGSATMTEWTMIQRLRTNPRLATVPLLLYGQEQGSDNQVALAGVLTKPVSPTTIVQQAHALQQSERGAILIVDDSAETRAYYQQLFTQAFPKHEIRSAANGALALELITREVPVLVVLDLVMPELDGFDLLEQLRAEPATRHIPVLVLSGQVLSLADIERLNYAHVVFQSKGMLAGPALVAEVERLANQPPALAPETSVLVKRAVAYIQQNYMHDLAKQELARNLGVSERHLSRIFREEMGVSVWDFLLSYRILQARTLLQQTTETVAVVAIQAGFNNHSYFCRVFQKATGLSPQEYRRQAHAKSSL